MHAYLHVYKLSIKDILQLGSSPKLKLEGIGLDQSKTLNSHLTTTTNFSTNSRVENRLNIRQFTDFFLS
jgi:hypothetical protein